MVERKKCILISLDDNIDEISNLTTSLNFIIEEVFIQHKEKPNPKYYLGYGKVKEIKEYLEENDIKTAIFNASLKPSQQYNLEGFLEITIYDRIRLILEIFSDRAHSEEARLQVELAKLQYEIPLLRDWIHKARYGERPGFMAGGEYEVAQYYEISRKRIKKMKEKLRKIEKERDLRRKKRRKLGYYLIGIVGYTNAGKSTLFNLISHETVKVENRLFTTLSTTTRKIPELEKPILLTDTVGLIDNLPHWVIEAFHSTLEEVFLSDIILLMLDISESIDDINRKLQTSFDILLPDLNPSNIILVLNKIDKVKDYESINNEDKLLDKIEMDHEIKDIITISAKNEDYKEKVINVILKSLYYPISLSILLPNKSESQGFISWLYKNSEIISIEYENQIKIELRCRKRDEGHIIKKCKSLNGKVTKDKEIET
ncbi:MAG: GTPase HflX [Thermoplasmata archaeon]|nr:MAG: GTPase HflX [Thermoplasmata archaeon]